MCSPIFNICPRLLTTMYLARTSNSINKVLIIALGQYVQPGVVDNRAHSHYSIVRTVEDNWSLGDQDRLDAKANSFMPLPNVTITNTQTQTDVSSSASKIVLPLLSVLLAVFTFCIA